MPLFGKARKDGHVIESYLNSSSELQPQIGKAQFIAHSSSDSDVKGSNRKGRRVKDSISEIRHGVPDAAPALSLSFEQPANETTKDANSVAHIPPRRPKRGDSYTGRQTGPSPAAAIALAAASKSVSNSPEDQVKQLQDARLTVKQAARLSRMCSKEIKARGLDTLGIFRPFRASESMQAQERLIQLFLMYMDPETYKGAFPNAHDEQVKSSLMSDGFGKVDAQVEFRKRLSNANINDVVALFKWGLRRLRLQPADLKSFKQYTWYETFLDEERDANYPVRAYSQLLLPTLPQPTQVLFNTILDLMSSISAHHVANAMSASKICKILGFWLFGRVGVDFPPQDLRSLVEAWETSGRVLEHLLLAFIRDQASRIHLMPSRLMQIIKDYPNFGIALKHKDLTQRTPCLNTYFTALPNRALLVEIQSENIIVSRLRPREARDTLRAALKAQDIEYEASEELNDWSALLGVACSAGLGKSFSEDRQPLMMPIDLKDDKGDRVARQESSLFSEEDARVMQIVSAEFERRRARIEGVSSSQNSKIPASSESNGSTKVPDTVYRFSAQSAEAFGWHSTTPNESSEASKVPVSRPKKSSLRPKPSTPTTLDSDPVGKLDWNIFASEGFEKTGKEAKGSSGDQLDLRLKVFNLDDEGKPVVKRQHSMGALRGKKSFNGASLQDISQYNNKAATALQTPTYTLQSVSLMALDETFIIFWQDQLLDDCVAARLPYLVVANLNKLTAGRLLGTAPLEKPSSCTKLLLISESVLPPRPPMPHSGSSRAGKGVGPLRRRHTSSAADDNNNNNGDENNNVAEKRSLFAPSIRSNWTASVSRTKDGLKRMGSALNVRKSSFDGVRD